MSSTKTQIMDHAETLMRSRGFNGFAFRELADAVGIKSASVHYHFPTKGDLAVSIMQRYQERFISALDSISNRQQSALKHYSEFIHFYQFVVKQEKSLTLCMMIGQSKAILPKEVSTQLENLINSILTWLTALIRQLEPGLTHQQAKEKATLIHAALQGGIIGALATNDIQYFERVAKQLEGFFSNK